MYIVGKVLKPQGIRGEVKVEIITSFPERFTDLKELFVKKDNQWQSCLVEQVNVTGRFAYVKFVGIDNRNQAVELKDFDLCVPKEALWELDSDEFYIHDLIGLDVFDEKNTRLGKILDVEIYKSNDVYILQKDNGDCISIPAVKDFIKEIDISSGKMIIYSEEYLNN